MSISGHLIKRYEPKKVAMYVPRKLLTKTKPLIDRQHFFQCIGKKIGKPDFTETKVNRNVNAFFADWDDCQKADDLRWLGLYSSNGKT